MVMHTLKAHTHFLIRLKEQTGDDLSDLYLEEREQDIRQALDEKRRQQLLVPGIIGPNELNDDMQD